MRSRPLAALGLLLGLSLGFAVSYWPAAVATRNSSGTYALPSGNPVVSGSTISSTVHNATQSDIATELTDSLSRSGKGAMLAQLKKYDGTCAAPGDSWGSDLNNGWWRPGADMAQLCANTVPIAGYDAGGWTFHSPLWVDAGMTVTNETANGIAIYARGTGTGVAGDFYGGDGGAAGIRATGGAANGNGVIGNGAGSGAGGLFEGGGTGVGVSGTGGASSGSAAGISGTGGSPNGAGISGTGTGTGVGGTFAGGTAATATDPSDALRLTNGYLDLSAVANPNMDAGISERLTPKNIVKAWANITTGAATPTLNDGFNVDSASCSANKVLVNFATAFASSTYSALVSGGLEAAQLWSTPNSATQVAISANDMGGTVINLCAVNVPINLVVLGAQ